ncbi:MAG TPA: TolC family protein [Gemmatimonadales bacterium]|nr:TolC family protein [Gemmatimonadales bacterium]
MVLLAGCAVGTSPSPGTPWTPPARAQTAPAPAPAVPPDLEARVRTLQLPDVLDIALRNNTVTREAWFNARAAHFTYDATLGRYFPTLTLDGSITKVKTSASQGRSAVSQTVYGPTLNLSWLLVDFGGRSGSIASARDQLLAADWTHNAAIQDVVLTVEATYFNYIGTRALLQADRITLAEADSNLVAAQQRHDVGLATIADVLQAKTARSQAELVVETTSGALQTARGALAVSMGFPANLPYDIDSVPLPTPPPGVAESVDSLITRALAARPDLAAARAQADAARARVSIARGDALPALSVTGSAGDTYFANRTPVPGSNYSLSLGIEIPLFAGGAHVYGIKSAQAAADAAQASAEGQAQLVISQVFTSFYGLQTATQRVRSTDDLLASATQSEQVALGRYRAGAGSVLDLLTAQSALADARAQQVTAHFGWYASLAQLAHDVGVLGLDGSSPIRLNSDSTGSH